MYRVTLSSIEREGMGLFSREFYSDDTDDIGAINTIYGDDRVANGVEVVFPNPPEFRYKKLGMTAMEAFNAINIDVEAERIVMDALEAMFLTERETIQVS